MKRLIIFLITFLFFVFGVSSVFAFENLNLSNNGRDFYMQNYTNCHGCYKYLVFYDSKTKEEIRREKVENFFSNFYFDDGEKKIYFKSSGVFFVLNSDFTLTKKFLPGGYSYDSYLYNGKIIDPLKNVSGFSKLQGINLYGNQVYYNVNGLDRTYRYYEDESNYLEVTVSLQSGESLSNPFSYNNMLYFSKKTSNKIIIFSLDLKNKSEFIYKEYDIPENFLSYKFNINYYLDYYLYISKKNSSLEVIKEDFSKNISNGKCYKKDIAYTSMFSFFLKDLTFKKFVDDEDHKAIFFGESGNNFEHSIHISNVENLTGFNFENITKKGNITFDFKNDFFRILRNLPLKFFDLYSYPVIDIYSVEPIEWIKIDGTLPNGHKKIGRLVKCMSDFSDGFGDIEIGKYVKLPKPSEDVCIQFYYTGVGTTDINIDFGTTNFKFHETDVCENDAGEIFIDGKKFDGKKEDLEEGLNGFDVDLGKENYGYYNDILNLNKLSEIKTNGDGFLVIESGKINDPIVENGKCKLFNENNLTFLYYSNGNISVNLSVKSIGFLDNSFGGIIDFVGGLFIGPLNNIIGLTGIITPFTFDNQEVCLFGDLKIIEFHKMMKGTDYYGKMTIFDYLVIFTFGTFIFFIIGGLSFFKGVSTPEGKFDPYVRRPYSQKGIVYTPKPENRYGLPKPKDKYKYGEYKIYR